MGYESLHITKLLSLQSLQVDDVIPILSPAVCCGFGRCGYDLIGICTHVTLVLYNLASC